MGNASNGCEHHARSLIYALLRVSILHFQAVVFTLALEYPEPPSKLPFSHLIDEPHHEIVLH